SGQRPSKQGVGSSSLPGRAISFLFNDLREKRLSAFLTDGRAAKPMACFQFLVEIQRIPQFAPERPAPEPGLPGLRSSARPPPRPCPGPVVAEPRCACNRQ